MKLIIAIIPDTDNDAVSQALTNADLRVTYIASTGGFLRRGHSTFLVGVDDEKVEQALAIIRKTVSEPSGAEKRRGVIFVLKVDQFIRF